MIKKLLAASLILSTMPTVAIAKETGASNRGAAWCLVWNKGVLMYRPCVGA